MEKFKLSTIEKSEKPGEPYLERKFERVEKREEKMSEGEIRRALINENQFKKYLNGISSKLESQWSGAFDLAAIGNNFTSYCMYFLINRLKKEE